MIVVDTNVLVYLFIEGERTNLAVELLRKEPHWVLPALWKSEFRNALIQSARHGVLDFRDARLFVQRAEAMFQRHTVDVPGDAVIALAQASTCSGYDCEFVALAEQLNVQLVTVDKRILHEFPQFATALDRYVTE